MQEKIVSRKRLLDIYEKSISAYKTKQLRAYLSTLTELEQREFKYFLLSSQVKFTNIFLNELNNLLIEHNKYTNYVRVFKNSNKK